MRDAKGRFSKGEGFRITLFIPTLTTLFYWMILLIILMPWISIISRLEILQKVLSIFEDLISKTKSEEKETPKKNGLFA